MSLRNSLAAKLARPELLTLEPYQSARRIGGRGDIWINANESPFNNSELDNLNRYPECQPPELISAYSRYSQVAMDSIITTRGADEAIELLIRTFCVPAVDSIACFGPTYGMYGISAKTANVAVKNLNLTTDYQLPTDIVNQTQGAKIVFICNPNNPTGTLIPTSTIEQVITSMPDRLVVVDEAYIEFCSEHSVAHLIERYENLVVLRTLSKAFALAGARCGFLLANPTICEMVMRVIAPYPVPAPVAQLATAALSEQGIETMKTQVNQLKTAGQELSRLLEQKGAKVLPANGNFVLAQFENSSDVQQHLTQSGIVARAYQDPRLANCIRFSFTSAQQHQELMTLLSTLPSTLSSHLES